MTGGRPLKAEVGMHGIDSGEIRLQTGGGNGALFGDGPKVRGNH